MKKLLCLMALALAAPAQAAPGPSFAVAQATPASTAPARVVAIPDDALTYAAYVAGRCFAHVSTDGKVEAARFMERQDADLSEAMFKAYYAGIEDARKQPPTRAQCESQLAKSQAELASYIR